MICFIDLDLTLCDQTDRITAAGKKPTERDKVKMQEWLDKLQTPESILADRPYPATIPLVRSLFNTGWQIVYLTGRSEKYRAVTLEWLNLHRYPQAPLLMRGNNDWRKPSEYKAEQMTKFLELKSKNELIMVLDDDHAGDCSEMYKRLFNAYHLKALGDR